MAIALMAAGSGRARDGVNLSHRCRRLLLLREEEHVAKQKRQAASVTDTPAPGMARSNVPCEGIDPEGCAQMTFELEEIRAVLLRCSECRTEVSFPRIRWANLLERCPNCGAVWMQAPVSGLNASETNATRAFKAVQAFREALQALIGLSRATGFTIGLETKEADAPAERTSPQTESSAM